MPAYLSDPSFLPAFDMYWRARLLGSYAGNRVCSLPNKYYNDPTSPYRPIDQRLNEAGRKFEARYPKALNNTARPYMMPPPQSLCEDAKAAWEALFAFETAVVALETQLGAGAGKS